jgi:dGTPase
MVRLPDGGYARHPLSFLVEAADDICYTIIDLEDAWRLGFLSGTEVIDLYESVIQRSAEDAAAAEKCSRAASPFEKISCMRGIAISTLVHAASRSFEANYWSIMEGSFTLELLRDEKSIGQCIPKALRKIKKISSRKIYASRNVCEDTLTITKALTSFLDVLGSELGRFEKNPKTRRANIVRARYPDIFDGTATPYLRLLYLTDALTRLSESGLLEDAALLSR